MSDDELLTPGQAAGEPLMGAGIAGVFGYGGLLHRRRIQRRMLRAGLISEPNAPTGQLDPLPDWCKCEHPYIGTQEAGDPVRCERCMGLVP